MAKNKNIKKCKKEKTCFDCKFNSSCNNELKYRKICDKFKFGWFVKSH